MAGYAQCHRIQATGDFSQNALGARQDQGQRTGPESFCQLPDNARDGSRPLGQLPGVGQVDDQRMIGRSPLGGENPRHRLPVARIGSEPVHRFGGKGHQSSRAEHRHGLIDRCWVWHGRTHCGEVGGFDWESQASTNGANTLASCRHASAPETVRYGRYTTGCLSQHSRSCALSICGSDSGVG